MTTVIRALFATLIALLVGCDRGSTKAIPAQLAPSTTQPVSSTQPSAKRPEYLNLLEAVFRYQFDHNASAGQRNVDYFFLSLDHTDPPAELLERFKESSPRVLPASMAKSSGGQRVTHKELPGRGLGFNITRIAWLDANTAEVDGGYYEGNLSASGNTYRVERRDGKWTVVSDRMHWIS